MASYNAGIVTAYGAAVRGGYTGTYEQFCAQQANYAQTAADVEQAKQDAQAAVQQAQDIADSIPEDYSQLSEDVSNLKEDLAEVTDCFDVVTSDNIYDVNSSTPNIIIDLDGTTTTNSDYTTSDYIPVTEGETIKSYYVVNGTVYPANMGRIACFDSSKIANSSEGSRSTVNTFTVPAGISYVRFSYSSGLNNFMIISGGAVPTSFIPYSRSYAASIDFVENALNTLEVVKGTITKEKTDFWTEVHSENLFDESDIITGEYFNANGTTNTGSTMFRSFVKINGAGDYSFYVCGLFFGLSNALKIPTFNASKEFVKTITATTSVTTPSYTDPATLTISNSDIADGVVYIGYSQKIANIGNNSLMVVKASSIPEEYVAYYLGWSVPDAVPYVSENPLFNKVAVFDGDSICAGLGSAMGDYGNGYASRIAVDNEMTAHNVGVSGATITAGLYFDGDTSRPRHWVSRYIDTIYSNYPKADYVIFEGGTNDADNLYGDTDALGTFDEADFTGPFDDETFYGAMDTLCQKALTYFPKAKIGFIVAHKMGKGFVTYTKNRYDFFTYASKVCKKWGIPVINLWDEGQLRPDIISMYDPNYNTIETATAQGLPYYDGQHLTAYGYDILSHKIAEWMKSL